MSELCVLFGELGDHLQGYPEILCEIDLRNYAFERFKKADVSLAELVEAIKASVADEEEILREFINAHKLWLDSREADASAIMSTFMGGSGSGLIHSTERRILTERRIEDLNRAWPILTFNPNRKR